MGSARHERRCREIQQEIEKPNKHRLLFSRASNLYFSMILKLVFVRKIKEFTMSRLYGTKCEKIDPQTSQGTLIRTPLIDLSPGYKENLERISEESYALSPETIWHAAFTAHDKKKGFYYGQLYHYSSASLSSIDIKFSQQINIQQYPHKYPHKYRDKLV